MYRVRQDDLPFKGSSHEFVGADHGDVNVSVFLLRALPGRPRTSSPPIRWGPDRQRRPRSMDRQRTGVRSRGRRHPGDQGRRDSWLSRHRRRTPGPGGRAPEPPLHPGEF